jgi:Leucine-rich repeat (LRR) protein
MMTMTSEQAFWMLVIFGLPFILAGILFLAAIVLFFRHRIAAGMCLLLAAASFLLGCHFWREDTRESRERHARTNAEWAAKVAADPETLRGSDIGDQELELLRKTTRLRNLNLDYCYLSGKGLQHVAGLTQLESLSLQGALRALYSNDEQDLALDCLKGLIQLQELNISCNVVVTDSGLQNLKGLTQLRKLNLSCTPITDAGLEYLEGMTDLRELDLTACWKITDAGLRHLKELRKLDKLSLADVEKVTDAGLEHLTALPNLQTLNLRGTAITDAGLARLSALKTLKELDVAETKVTYAGVRKLQQTATECKVFGHLPQVGERP